MPIYEYQCTSCDHHLEVLQKMTDEPLAECPVCHQSTLNKLVSAAGFQLKGFGWYATDYKDKGKSSAKGEAATTSDTKEKSQGSEQATAKKDDKGATSS